MRLKRVGEGALIVAAAFALDRFTKMWAYRALSGEAQSAVASGHAEPITVLPGVLRFRFAQNTGIAFGMLSDALWALILFSLVLLVGLAVYVVLKPGQRPMTRVGMWLIVGGGLGNLFDRVVRGYVIDFIEPLFVRFAVFNVADVCICVGAALAALGVLLGGRKIKPDGGNRARSTKAEGEHGDGV